MRKCPVCKKVLCNKWFRKHVDSCMLSEESSTSDTNLGARSNEPSSSDAPSEVVSNVIEPLQENEEPPIVEEVNNPDQSNPSDDFHFPEEMNLEDLDEEILEMISQRLFENTNSDEEIEDSDNEIEIMEFGHEPANQNAASIGPWICLFLALWQFHFNITDSAFECLLKFVHGLLSILVEHCNLDAAILVGFPSSLYLYHKFINTCERFKKYVVCIKCHTLYEMEQCVVRIQGQQVSKRCSHIEFPDHNRPHLRKQCGQELLESVTVGNRTTLIPYKTYCYKPLSTTLKYLFKRKNFFELCQSWMNRQVHAGIMSDIYDGQVWKDFADPEKMDFLNHPGNLGIMLNCDWFCPYKNVWTYSVGAIYSVIMNLPRSIR